MLQLRPPRFAELLNVVAVATRKSEPKCLFEQSQSLYNDTELEFDEK